MSKLSALAGQAKGPNRSRQGSAEAEGGGGAARSTEGSVEAFSVGRPVSDVCVSEWVGVFSVFLSMGASLCVSHLCVRVWCGVGV